MTTKLVSPRGTDLRFKAGETHEDAKEKFIPSTQEKGRLSTQESEEETGFRSPRRGMKSGRQGEFSGVYDKGGHHLKADGTPDMRFKENREEFQGQGYEYTSPKRLRRPISLEPEEREKEEREEKEEKKPRISKREEKEEEEEKHRISKRKERAASEEKITKPKVRIMEKPREKERQRRPKPSLEHIKSDGTPDMRFKENRDKFSGQGYENLTTRGGRGTYGSKANIGIYEGNVPGEHSGKFDSKGHHLKSDGTPDMRFKENREEFSGQGYESPRDPETGYARKSSKYLKDEEEFTNKIYYRRKRPPTPYAIYIRENAPEMKKRHPDMDMNEVFRELGEKWRNSSEKEHRKYYDMYDEEVRRFQYTNQFPHRGPLAFRKFAHEHGYGSSMTKISPTKRPKYDRDNRKIREEDDDQENEDEENVNPNEAITA
jgi:hypothetical protein